MERVVSCVRCGKALSPHSQFCDKCGKKVLSPDEDAHIRRRTKGYKISSIYEKLADEVALRIAGGNKALAHEVELRLTEKLEKYLRLALTPKDQRPPDPDTPTEFALGVWDTILNENADLKYALRKQLGIPEPPQEDKK